MTLARPEPSPTAMRAGEPYNQPGGLAGRRVGLAIVCLALLSGFSTYLILTGLTPIVPTHGIVVSMLLVNGLLIVAMLAMVGWQLRGLWRARRRQAAAARLHTRIVGLFSVIALMPAILLVIFATLSLDRGLDNWFSARIQSIIANSIDVASAYVNEQGQVIRSDALGMARELESSVQLLSEDREAFEKFLTAQAALRAIPVAYVIDGAREPVAQASSRSEIGFKKPPRQALGAADEGRIVELALQSDGAVGALTKIAGTEDRYLYVIRPVNPKVLGHLRTTRANAAEYSQLEQRRAGIQVAFAAMFISISLTFLLAAIWAGLWFADRLVAPIRHLIDAAYAVSQGNLDVAVPPASKKEDDVGKLSTAFNRMTADLRTQRNELVDANTQLDERRRFTEAVLSGVTAGVIGLDRQGNVTLANRSALELLEKREDDLVGKPLAETLPDFAELMVEAKKQGKKPVQSQIKLLRADGERNFAVRFTREGSRNKDYGFVVTFDDITELVVAQRTSAWADVARRIAHEIKNPLTPIQLSAERIRRRYGDQIEGDREVFDRCTETIVRHVGDIRRMVDEFSAFARMPKPVIEAHDVNDIVREALVLFQMSNSDIAYKLDVADAPVVTNCDRRLLSQAMTNLIKNASEAVEAAIQAQRDAGNPEFAGQVTARVTAQEQSVLIEVVDNGGGLPKEDRHRLIEPYVTNRQKGTGLGLAIVQKIVEQHQGTLELNDAEPAAQTEAGETRGARVSISLPLSEAASEGGNNAAEQGSGSSQQSGARTTAREKQGVSHGI
jgi:two-component system nitrogen regulation sensor histidine kinase NtrY